MYSDIHMYTHIYIYTYMHIHTYIYACIHVHTYKAAPHTVAVASTYCGSCQQHRDRPQKKITKTFVILSAAQRHTTTRKTQKKK